MWLPPWVFFLCCLYAWIFNNETWTACLYPALQPYLQLSTQWVQWQTVFIPWELFGICEISQTGVKKLLSSYVCCYVSCCWFNWSLETEAKLQLCLWKTCCITCLKKTVLEFITPCVLRGIFCWNTGCNASVWRGAASPKPLLHVLVSLLIKILSVKYVNEWDHCYMLAFHKILPCKGNSCYMPHVGQVLMLLIRLRNVFIWEHFCWIKWDCS